MPKTNISADKDENTVFVSISPNIHSVDVIYSSAYVFLERAYVMIEGHPTKEIIVGLTPKNDEDLEKLGREFNNTLVTYSTYESFREKNKSVREMLLSRALFTNYPRMMQPPAKEEKKTPENDNNNK